MFKKSNAAKPERLELCLFGAAMACLFIIYFGIYTKWHDFHKMIRGTESYDFSILELGQRFIDHLLGQAKGIPRMVQLKNFNPDQKVFGNENLDDRMPVAKNISLVHLPIVLIIDMFYVQKSFCIGLKKKCTTKLAPP